jgi:hypothetical protein
VSGNRTSRGREAESLCRAGEASVMEAFEAWVYAPSSYEAREEWLRFEYIRGWTERQLVAWWVEVCLNWRKS